MSKISERDAAVIAAYKAGENLQQLRRRFSLSMHSLRQIVLQHASRSVRQPVSRDRDLPAVGSFGG